jgi:hypothetical protein
VAALTNIFYYSISLLLAGMYLVVYGCSVLVNKRKILLINGEFALLLIRLFKGKFFAENKRHELMQESNLRKYAQLSLISGILSLLAGLSGLIYYVSKSLLL